MNILLLGDCIAVGQNLLMPEITNNKDIRVPEFNVNKQFEKEIVKWFLKNKTWVDYCFSNYKGKRLG